MGALFFVLGLLVPKVEYWPHLYKNKLNKVLYASFLSDIKYLNSKKSLKHLLYKILGEPRYPIDKKKPDLGEGFSYFNLQSYMKDHFVKETPVA